MMIYFGNFNLNVPSYFRHNQLRNWKISWNFHEARNKSDAHKPSAFEYYSWKYWSQRDLCSCSWDTLENSSKNLRPEFQSRRPKEKFKAIVWKDNEHTAKSFISRVKIYKYICGPVSVGFAKMFTLLTRSSSSAFKLWKMWWRPAALRVVAWRHETLSPIWLWFSSTLDSDQLCTTPSRHTVMNLRSIVAAWPRISHLFFKPKMRETPETVMAFQLGIVGRWKKCWISFSSLGVGIESWRA